MNGNVYVSDRLDIRSEGSVTGGVTAQRISIGDGAFFKGGIDISKPGQEKDGMVVAGIFSGHPQTGSTAVQAQPKH